MADNKHNPDEYEYPSEDDYYKGVEDQPGADPFDMPESKRRRLSSFASRRLYLILGFLVAIGLVYLLVAYKNMKKTAELSSPTPVITGPTNIIPASQIQPVQVPPAAKMVVTPSPETGTIQNLNAQNQANQAAITNLQGQIQQLQGQMTNLGNVITTLNNQLQVMVNEVRAISIDRQLKGRNISLPAGKFYILKALVPGRAWLQSKDGGTIAVTIGDRLPGYGMIQSINVPQGIVTTSSGMLIQYGPRDS